MSVPALSFWTDLLRLPDYEVVSCQEEADLRQYRLTVAPRQPRAVCPHCGKVSDTLHQTRTRSTIRDGCRRSIRAKPGEKRPHLRFSSAGAK
jgi:transposase